MYGLWQQFGWGGFDEPGMIDDEWGRSECLDPDDVGDIADEGAGHRG